MVKRAKAAGRQGLPGRLRIVAGNWRSRLLDIADVPGLRPTSERVRETLFNWLAPRIAGARCLDLYAGTGALGFEALSRGAAAAVFVEQSRRAARMLRHNVDLLGAVNAEVVEGNAENFITSTAAGRFDIVFLDPPFAHNALGDLCRLLAGSRLLAPGALIYLEDDRRRPDVALPAGWRVVRRKQTGSVRYALVEAGGQQQGES